MPSIVNSVENMINKVNASSDIKNKAIDDANDIYKQDFSKENIKQNLEKFSCNLPNEIANQNNTRYYYMSDVAYNVYITLKELHKYSDKFCWCIANIYLMNATLIYHISDVISIDKHDITIQKIIDNPINFIIKECLIGTIQLIIGITISALNPSFISIYSSYIILIMLNLMKLMFINNEEEEYK